MRDGLSRRQFLRLTSAGAATVALGSWWTAGCSDGGEPALPPALTYFNEHQRATVEAAAARILPADDLPGAKEAGVVQYIENLLAAFDAEVPLIFAGGPFSSRQPFPDNANGTPSDDFPDNAFLEFLPPTRVQEIGWRMRILGSANTPGGDFNDAALGPTIGWQERYRDGLAALDGKSQELFAVEFAAASAEQQDEVLTQADQDFVSLLVEHVIEGMYAAPEYGGNRDLLGWQSIGFEGDTQPLGYSIFDESTNSYHELADRPMSTPNTDETFALDAETVAFVESFMPLVQGERFF
jgi:hypothetical protein